MDALALRDIHLPAEPGLWPLAWGWWLFACLDRGLSDQPFTLGLGQILTDVYRNDPLADWDIDAVHALCLRWLKQQAKRGVADV